MERDIEDIPFSAPNSEYSRRVTFKKNEDEEEKTIVIFRPNTTFNQLKLFINMKYPSAFHEYDFYYDNMLLEDSEEVEAMYVKNSIPSGHALQCVARVWVTIARGDKHVTAKFEAKFKT
ncbi:hypothetical protein ACFE04_010501 [Oxalis oulophora]